MPGEDPGLQLAGQLRQELEHQPVFLGRLDLATPPVMGGNRPVYLDAGSEMRLNSASRKAGGVLRRGDGSPGEEHGGKAGKREIEKAVSGKRKPETGSCSNSVVFSIPR
jgi:hypothetical protein